MEGSGCTTAERGINFMKQLFSICAVFMAALSVFAGNEYHGSFVDDASGKTSVPGSAISSLIATSRIPFYNDGNIIYVAPNGSDANNGLTKDTPVKTFGRINALNKNGATIQFMPGAYPTELTNLYLTNNTIIAYGAVHSTGVGNMATAMLQFYSGSTPGTNSVYGGTWISTNQTIGAMRSGIPTTNETIVVYDTRVLGNTDGIYFDLSHSDAKSVVTCDIRNNYLTSIDWDAFAINGLSVTNTYCFLSGNTIITQDGGSTISRGISGSSNTMYSCGNSIRVQGTVDSAGIEGIEFSGGVINTTGDNINLIGPGAQYIGNAFGGTSATFNITGHPWPDSLMAFRATDVVNFLGWDGAAINNLNVTNLNIYGNINGNPVGTLPFIVATVNLSGLTSSLPSTNFYTTSSTGLYRISANILANGISGSGFEFTVSSANMGTTIIDENGVATGTNPNKTFNGPFSHVVSLASGDTLSCAVPTTPATTTYKFYVTVEKISQ